ncbi:MAG: hypothetical protein RR310_08895 [Eubacterium sp.]
MQTTIYLANHAIQILQGDMKGKKLFIKKFHTEAMEEGALINGVITNEDMLLQAIKTAEDESDIDFHNTTLIINSSLIMNKNVKVPKLKPNELRELSKHEFEETSNHENLVIDYTGICGIDHAVNMFCCAVEKDVLESYVHLFDRAGIKLRRIDTALNATIKYIEASAQYANQTFAINILDGNNLLYVLFENGRYTFSSRSRIMAERQTEGFTIEMASKLSSLVQFNKSQKSEYILGKAFYAGLNEDEIGDLQEYLLDTEVAIFKLPNTENIAENFNIDKDDFELDTAFYVAASFFEERSDINLYTAYKEIINPKKHLSLQNKWVIPPLLIVAVMVIGFIVFTIMNYNAGKALKTANKYLNDAGNVSSYAEAKKIEEDLGKIKAQATLMETSRTAINGYPQVNSDKVYQILSLGNGITVGNLSYDFTKGALSIGATAPNEFAAAEYVSQLNTSGLFSKIEYEGYTMAQGSTETVTKGSTTTTLPNGSTEIKPNVETVTIPDSYTFSLIGYLKPGVAQ